MVSILPFLGLLFLVWSVVFYFINKKIIAPIAEQNEMLLKTSAIARTTQGLAHDIRRPFQMLKMTFDSFVSAPDAQSAQVTVRELLPEVDKAMASVEGMLQDIMQIGSESKPNLEVSGVEAILGAALEEVFRIFPDGQLQVAFDLRHSTCVNVDTIRVGRVFTNILVNAAQAMGGTGQLWISTKDSGELVEFRLGNAGTVIPKENLSRLFEAFFTHGKKGGTGLGLAIAQKVVMEHGGTIRCESDKSTAHPNGFVEFVFTLPKAADQIVQGTLSLFESSAAYREHVEKIRTALREQASPSVTQEFYELENMLRQRIEDTEQLSVVVLDDEAAYRNLLKGLFSKEDSALSKVKVFDAKSAAEAESLVKMHRPFLVISDVELNDAFSNGLEFILSLRTNGFNGRICVHSNRFLLEDQKSAFEAGADTVLPKPMGRGHLLKMVLASLPEGSKNPEVKEKSRELRIAYVDDTKTFTTMWRLKLKNTLSIDTFQRTPDFFKRCVEAPDFLQSLDLIVTDYHFADDDPLNGKTFAEELRVRGFSGPILLATNGDFSKDELGPCITVAIPKTVPDREFLEEFLK